ncbi:leucine zipper transcription factor-like protein 1 isoform X2 [Homalodisca vitripennis]|nr:leucine zipper transcription factor-like protein 1 isoform X2 [Homalodisca vitripennis]XP_046684135.1 leucine zipper transcription factor-like protein 1 isoform X2 [Homalodisca vitripennis]XP_046684136.1 leucine zipper transcription factor-like protein 1 isoform X2 [Homalodisca vitripennis]KAG8305192.1 Leucine zipper transcription factor-like protein 1, variant 2 [Homalodisca vitripennis]
MCIQDVLDTRLLETTFTQREVEEMLQGLKILVHSEVETELISLAHTSVLLLSQVLQQAEKWHLRLNIDLSEVQNSELLEHVKALETSELGGRTKLEPLQSDDGSLELLRIEIERLQSENQRLEDSFKHLENQIIQLKEDRNKLIGLAEKKDEKISELKLETEQLNQILKQQSTTTSVPDDKPDAEHLLSQYEKVLSEQLGSEMEAVRQQMQTVQVQLSLAEQELERKFNQTTTYMNMKRIIGKKNEQVKELRKKLLKYEPQESADSD